MSCCSVTTPRMYSDAQIRAGQAEVLCKNGHVVTKCKDTLKPWQGVVRKRYCGACGKQIERDEPHWRCEEHCSWDICHGCFADHWTRVIKAARDAEKIEIKKKLLEAVPESRRNLSDYKEAVKSTKRPPPSEERKPNDKSAATKYLQSAVSKSANSSPEKLNGSGKAKTDQPAPTGTLARMAASSANRTSRKVTFQQDSSWKLNWEKYEVQICIGTLLVVSPVALVAQRKLLADKSLQFPSPWLMVAFTNLLVALFCRIAVCIVKPTPAAPPMPIRPGFPPFPQIDTEVPWKQASILGVMHAVELGIAGFIVRYNTIGTRNEIYFVMPLFFLAAGILSATEPWPLHRSLGAGVLCMALGGILSRPSPWQLVSFEQLPLILLSGSCICLRWIWSNNIFPPLSSGEIPKSALVLASRMSPTTGVTGLELTFLTSVSHLGALTAIFKTPDPLAIVGLLILLACCNAATLVAELRLVQISSITLLGFLGPLRQAGASLIFAPLILGEPPPHWIWGLLCVLFCSVGIVFFIDARRDAEKEGSKLQQPPRGHAMTYAPTEAYYRKMSPQDGDWV